jgi:hypothetical protein
MKRTLRLAAVLLVTASGAQAERVANPIAMFAGLNKITGVTTNFEASVGGAVEFDSFIVKPAVCFSRPITEAPKTTAFVQIDARQPDGALKRIFSGWMFAESPGLNAVEDPILDVWLTSCRDPNAPPPPVETPRQLEEEEKSGDDTNPLD